MHAGPGAPGHRVAPASGRDPAPATGPVVTIYSDGACFGNPGPGGWAAIVIEEGHEHELSGSEPASTNQRMELTAAIAGLESLRARRRVEVHSDSAYVVNCFRDRWYDRWRRNNWRNAQGKPVDNRDLWERLLALAEHHEVTWHKVAGHAGHPLNERADRLAKAAIQRMLGDERQSG